MSPGDSDLPLHVTPVDTTQPIKWLKNAGTGLTRAHPLIVCKSERTLLRDARNNQTPKRDVCVHFSDDPLY